MTWLDGMRGKGLKHRLLHPHDEFWDRRLGVRTLGFLPAVGTVADANWQGHYVPAPYRDVFSLLRHAGVGRDDVFVDLGCGLGRVVFAASQLGARRAVGVEIDSSLAAQCIESGRRGGYDQYRVEFVCAPAQTYRHSDTTVMFMFHPFGAGTMREVISGLDAALDANPRQLTVVYLNPVFDELLLGSRHLRRIEHWPARQATRFRGARYAASFWRSGDQPSR